MCVNAITLCRIKNSELEKMIGYEINEDVDVALRVPKKMLSIMSKPKAPVNLIWDVEDLTGKNIDASLRMGVRKLSVNYKGPKTVMPYAVIGGKEELKGFVERYKMYESKGSDFVHVLTLTYG